MVSLTGEPTANQPDRQPLVGFLRRIFAKAARAFFFLSFFFTLPPPPFRSQRRRKLFPDDDYDDDGCIMPRCSTRPVSATDKGGADGRRLCLTYLQKKRGIETNCNIRFTIGNERFLFHTQVSEILHYCKYLNTVYYE